MARHRRKKQLKKRRVREAPSRVTPVASAAEAKKPESIPKPTPAIAATSPAQSSYPWVKSDLIRIVFFGGGAMVTLIILAILDHTTTIFSGNFKL
jgi:hypothetical protein